MDKALIVGINNYPFSPLAGCINDAYAVRDYLLRMGFVNDNICLLLNNNATTAAIMNELNWLIAVDPDNRCYFHYSGHGAQIPSESEADHLSELIVPFEFDWTPSHMITDKQLVEIFKRIPSQVKFNWSSDSCHSGDLDRAILRLNPVKQKSRHLEPPPAIVEQIRLHTMHRKTRGVRDLIGGVLNVGFISACQSTESAADTMIDGKSCGAFTYCFLHNLDQITSLFNIASKTQLTLRSLGYDQIPTVGGARINQPFLG